MTAHLLVARRTERLLTALMDVTLEDFRAEDRQHEHNSRLGRELLHLLANTEWCRRTTEIVDVSQVHAVETRVVVDVDLARADHEALRRDGAPVWLPLLTLPSPATADGSPGPGGESAVGLDVEDGAGTRVPKLTQAEVHHRLSAALADLVLNVMAGRAGREPAVHDRGAADLFAGREHGILLSAALRRMLPGDGARIPDASGVVPEGLVDARQRLRDLLTEDLRTANAAASAAAAGDPVSSPDDDDDDDGPPAAGPPRPVLGSHVGEMIDALMGTTFVVVAAEDLGRAQSFTVTVPARRLVRRVDRWRPPQPRALLSIDLLAPSAHADRQIRLVLPEGVVCLDGERTRRTLARIDVVLPAPFERVGTLMRRLFPPRLDPDRPASWVDGRIAEMALHKVDAALDCLRHYEVTALRAAAVPADGATAEVERRLRALRAALAAVRRGTVGTVPMTDLRAAWDGGSWFPAAISRRLAVNTASPGSVVLRATAVDDVGLRARPALARIDAEVAVADSPVFNVARYAGTLNLLVLGVLAALLTWQAPAGEDDVQRELLATVLTLFSAVQASRVEHPDGATLRGMLSRAGYWLMIASVLPTVLLALALAVVAVEHVPTAATAAALAQGLLLLRLRRGPLWGSLRRPPRITLATTGAGDHARADVLSNGRSRALTAEALLLGREAHAFVVARGTGPGEFDALLAPDPEHDGGDPLAVIRSATAGATLTYLVFREPPDPGWLRLPADPAERPRPVPLDPDRLVPAEPPEWTLEVLIGMPDAAATAPLRGHPLLTVLAEAVRWNFRVLAVHLPAPPPPGGSGRRWARVRVGVSYRRGDSLRGLGSFLDRVRGLDGAPMGTGSLSVTVRVDVGRLAAHRRGAQRPLQDKDFDVVPDHEAATVRTRDWRVLALTAYARTGLLHAILDGLAAIRPGFALAGLTMAMVHGQAVVFLVGRDPMEAGPGEDVGRGLARQLRAGDRLTVAVDRRLTARDLDGPPLAEQLLLRVALRLPDRPGALRELLAGLAAELDETTRGGLDVWFAMVEVADGRTARGRLTVRLPGAKGAVGRWDALDWTAVARAVSRDPADGTAGHPSGGGPGSLVQLDLLRVAATTPRP